MLLEVIENISEEQFVYEYIARNKPGVIKGLKYNENQFRPDVLADTLGDLPCQIYNSLFDLQSVAPMKSYIEDYFGIAGEYRRDIPYIRWYNKFKDIDYAWGDEAFARLVGQWWKPDVIPSTKFVVPLVPEGGVADPVTDSFPYRGILIAARGARTRVHTDPFFSDAYISQFYGTKEVSLYHPSRRQEMLLKPGALGNSFGGYTDVRSHRLDEVSLAPDYHGLIVPGDTLYVPHGWLHDVIVVEDSISITWNSVHERGAAEYLDYLLDAPEKDSEFEVLRYYYRMSDKDFCSGQEIVEEYGEIFSELIV